MANTYSKIYLHAIFAAKNRQALIPKSFSQELYRYMAGVIKSEGQIPLMINGMPDHVHLAFAIQPKISVSDLVRSIKSNSSKWINEKGVIKSKFEWQRGFGVFSYGQSQVSDLIRYIDRQEIHHGKRSFKEEYIGFLRAFEIEFKEEYIFDWI